ncbi:MAG: hypothetical protein NC250_07410 [Alistipes senegalensis]|nr:hypothetical protein [Bacteroides cellulosilyticus]MCM1352543.1 hypothetical protein [Alistipes senegalensis]
MMDIPKLIHFCWLSGEAYPEKIARCIESWHEKMPDYEIMLWDRARFDREVKNEFAIQAVNKRKWAFAADYIRLFALYTYGGVYLDSDVKVYKPFDDFLSNAFFSGIEYFKPTNYVAIEAAVMGSIPNHPFVGKCLEEYESCKFIKEDGSLDMLPITVRMADIAKMDWGFEFVAKEQHLKDNIVLYPPVTFTNPSGIFSQKETYALHLCNGSWVENKPRNLLRVINFVKRYYNKPFTALVNLLTKLLSLIRR